MFPNPFGGGGPPGFNRFPMGGPPGFPPRGGPQFIMNPMNPILQQQMAFQQEMMMRQRMPFHRGAFPPGFRPRPPPPPPPQQQQNIPEVKPQPGPSGMAQNDQDKVQQAIKALGGSKSETKPDPKVEAAIKALGGAPPKVDAKVQQAIKALEGKYKPEEPKKKEERKTEDKTKEAKKAPEPSPKKEEIKKETPKKVEPKKETPKKVEPKKETPKKVEPEPSKKVEAKTPQQGASNSRWNDGKKDNDNKAPKSRWDTEKKGEKDTGRKEPGPSTSWGKRDEPRRDSRGKRLRSGDWECQVCDTINIGLGGSCFKCTTPKEGRKTEKRSFEPARDQNPVPSTSGVEQKKAKIETAAAPMKTPEKQAIPSNPVQEASPSSLTGARKAEDNKLMAQEAQFDNMFKSWEDNYNQWKKDNENNPNKAYMNNHIASMEELRQKMLTRRENIRQKRRELLEQQKAQVQQQQAQMEQQRLRQEQQRQEEEKQRQEQIRIKQELERRLQDQKRLIMQHRAREAEASKPSSSESKPEDFQEKSFQSAPPQGYGNTSGSNPGYGNPPSQLRGNQSFGAPPPQMGGSQGFGAPPPQPGSSQGGFGAPPPPTSGSRGFEAPPPGFNAQNRFSGPPPTSTGFGGQGRPSFGQDGDSSTTPTKQQGFSDSTQAGGYGQGYQKSQGDQRFENQSGDQSYQSQGKASASQGYPPAREQQYQSGYDNPRSQPPDQKRWSNQPEGYGSTTAATGNQYGSTTASGNQYGGSQQSSGQWEGQAGNQWEKKTANQWDKKPGNQWETKSTSQWDQKSGNQWDDKSENQWEKKPANQWDNQSENQWQKKPAANQWDDKSETQWGKKPDNQWETQAGSRRSESQWEKPSSDNQWGSSARGQWGNQSGDKWGAQKQDGPQGGLNLEQMQKLVDERMSKKDQAEPRGQQYNQGYNQPGPSRGKQQQQWGSDWERDNPRWRSSGPSAKWTESAMDDDEEESALFTRESRSGGIPGIGDYPEKPKHTEKDEYKNYDEELGDSDDRAQELSAADRQSISRAIRGLSKGLPEDDHSKPSTSGMASFSWNRQEKEQNLYSRGSQELSWAKEDDLFHRQSEDNQPTLQRDMQLFQSSGNEQGEGNLFERRNDDPSEIFMNYGESRPAKVIEYGQNEGYGQIGKRVEFASDRFHEPPRPGQAPPRNWSDRQNEPPPQQQEGRFWGGQQREPPPAQQRPWLEGDGGRQDDSFERRDQTRRWEPQGDRQRMEEERPRDSDWMGGRRNRDEDRGWSRDRQEDRREFDRRHEERREVDRQGDRRDVGRERRDDRWNDRREDRFDDRRDSRDRFDDRRDSRERFDARREHRSSERPDFRDSRRGDHFDRRGGREQPRHQSREPQPSTSSSSASGPPAGKLVQISDLLDPPGRYIRPPRFVIIFRGLPGSGKSYIAKQVKARETELGTDAPRILSLDDYFDCDGEYEYESALEPSYRQSLVKSFKKQIDDGYFAFIMVDCVNEKTSHYQEMADYAQQKGFEVFIAELDDQEPGLCAARNIHDRSASEIEALAKTWDPTPKHFNRIDLRIFMQDREIQEVEMEEVVALDAEKDQEDFEGDEEEGQGAFKLSKWEVMDNENKMAQLDGVSRRARDRTAEHDSIEEWLSLNRSSERDVASGKKRVRWADIEEKRAQFKMREVGFVVGQTNWNRMLDPTEGQSALTKTKIIPNRFDFR